MRKFRVNHTDVLNRWKEGEIGEELTNDMPEKYFVCLRFPGTIKVRLFKSQINVVRVFYFYKSEVNVVEN
jgi:hypothetical protein